MSRTAIGDLKQRGVYGLTLAPAVITADVATNPSIAVDCKNAEQNINVFVSLGVVHADTTGVVTVVESDTGVNGTWTTATNIEGNATISFTGTSDAGTQVVNIIRTKRYVGATVDLSGATLSAGISILVLGANNYTPAVV